MYVSKSKRAYIRIKELSFNQPISDNDAMFIFFYELLFRSVAVQEQIQRAFTQTAQPKIGNESLENIIIPVVEEERQRRIAALINKSFALRGESGRLLNEAKELVEREIEKG